MVSDVDRARSRGPGKCPPEVAARHPGLSAQWARDRCAPKAGQWTESRASVHDKATSSLLKGTEEGGPSRGRCFSGPRGAGAASGLSRTRPRVSLLRRADSRTPSRASPTTQAPASLMQITAVEPQKHGEGKLESAFKGPRRLLAAQGRERDG